jgi:thiol-disulfide isomerase/thioredoxin
MRWITALVAALVLLLTGCGTQSDSTASPGSGAAGASRVADLDFSGTTLDGQQFDGHALSGKPAVLWFWAPWCPTCRAQIPNVSALAEQYDGRLSVVGVGGLDSAGAIEEIAAQIPHVAHLVDDEGAVWRHFGVTAQSTYTVIAADGRIVSEGYLDDGNLNALVAELVDGDA